MISRLAPLFLCLVLLDCGGPASTLPVSSRTAVPGAHVHWIDNDIARPQLAAYLSALHPAWVRASLPYDLTSGGSDMGAADSLAALVQTWGGHILWVLPDYLTPYRTDMEMWVNTPTLAAFAGMAAKRYPSAMLELSNEPNAYVGPNQPVSPITFVSYAKALSVAVRPAKIVSGGLSGVDSVSESYMQSCIQLGLANYVDYIGWHPYGSTNFAASAQEAQAVSSKPILFTEYGTTDIPAQPTTMQSYFAQAPGPFAIWYDLESTDGFSLVQGAGLSPAYREFLTLE